MINGPGWKHNPLVEVLQVLFYNNILCSTKSSLPFLTTPPVSSGLCGPTTSLATRPITQSRPCCTSTSVTRRWARRAAWLWWAPAGTSLRQAPASWSSTCRSVRLWVRPSPASPSPPWSALDCDSVALQTRLDLTPPPSLSRLSCRESADSEGLGRRRRTRERLHL